MKGMTIRAMTQACHGIYHGDEGAVDIEISAITTDSRKIQKNGMFIAICGEKSDGHDYIGKCFDDGALCCISEREPDNSKPYKIKQAIMQNDNVNIRCLFCMFS